MMRVHRYIVDTGATDGTQTFEMLKEEPFADSASVCFFCAIFETETYAETRCAR